MVKPERVSASGFELVNTFDSPSRTYWSDSRSPDRLSLIIVTPPRCTDDENGCVPSLLDLTWFQFEERVKLYIVAGSEELPAPIEARWQTGDLLFLTDRDSHSTDERGVTSVARVRRHDQSGAVFLTDDSGTVRASWAFPSNTVTLRDIQEAIDDAAEPNGVAT